MQLGEHVPQISLPSEPVHVPLEHV
jgi:hypothetical protein